MSSVSAAAGKAAFALASLLTVAACAQPSHPIPYSQLPPAAPEPRSAVRSRDPAIPPYSVAPGADRRGLPGMSPAAAPPSAKLPPVAVAPPASSAAALRPLASLPGWAAEDHLAALKAFRAGCGIARGPAWRAVCDKAKTTALPTEDAARAFFEANFMAEAASPQGLLTAYFSPEYPAQATPDEVFSAPVRPRPDDVDAFADRPRAEIETDPAEGVKAFMKAEDLFFLQIQGSGVLTFPDGRKMRAVYSGDNGLIFTAIARPMLQAGMLSASNLSGDAIRAWLAAHRGPEADAVMDKNERYIFFDLVPDDGREPAGAAGTPLTAGRALAVDPGFHRYGELYWIDADAPSLAGAVPTYRRLAMALDTGAAIRGERRADLYLGRGDAAGKEAGRVRHVLSLVRLIPNAPGSTTAGTAHETPPPPG